MGELGQPATNATMNSKQKRQYKKYKGIIRTDAVPARRVSLCKRIFMVLFRPDSASSTIINAIFSMYKKGAELEGIPLNGAYLVWIMLSSPGYTLTNEDLNVREKDMLDYWSGIERFVQYGCGREAYEFLDGRSQIGYAYASSGLELDANDISSDKYSDMRFFDDRHKSITTVSEVTDHTMFKLYSLARNESTASRTPSESVVGWIDTQACSYGLPDQLRMGMPGPSERVKLLYTAICRPDVGVNSIRTMLLMIFSIHHTYYAGTLAEKLYTSHSLIFKFKKSA